MKRCIPIISIPVVGKRHVSTKTYSNVKKEARSEKSSKTVRSTTETDVCEKCCITDKCNAGLLCDILGRFHQSAKEILRLVIRYFIKFPL